MDRTALITGGTGALGRAVVARFAADGWRVVAAATRAGEVAGASVVAADLSDPAGAAEAVAAAAGDPAAPLGAVVHTVGGFAAGQPVATTPIEAFEAQFALNVRPAYLVAQAALPALVEAGGGAIVCVSSRAALHPFAGASGYCASKTALMTLVEVIAREHAGDGVRCNAVLPAMIDTPQNRAAMPEAQHGQLTPPEEIAATIAFLCGPDAAPTTGAAIPAYGGA